MSERTDRIEGAVKIIGEFVADALRYALRWFGL